MTALLAVIFFKYPIWPKLYNLCHLSHRVLILHLHYGKGEKEINGHCSHARHLFT
jgi:hypothetical protein